MTHRRKFSILTAALAWAHVAPAFALTVDELSQRSIEFQRGYFVAIYDALVSEVKVTECVEQLGPDGIVALMRSEMAKRAPKDRQVLGALNVTLLARLEVEKHCLSHP